jgi:hypothetical protein
LARTGSLADLPSPGELEIKEPRSWKSWQMAVAVFVTALLGMLIGNLTAGSSGTSQASSGKGAYSLPPPASTSGGVTTTTSATAAAGTNSTTSLPVSSTTLPAGGSPTTTTTVTGTATVLLGPYQSHGAWTSTPFTIGGGQWNIGWAFQCTPAPAAGPAFQIFVLPAGGSPSGAPAVSETGGSGQSITSQTSTGSQELQVEAGANCVWAVKVTGIA